MMIVGPHASRDEPCRVQGGGKAVIHGRCSGFRRADGGDVVSVQDEARILQADDGREAVGFQVFLGFRVVLDGQGGEACGEIPLVRFQGRGSDHGRSEGLVQMTHGSADVNEGWE